MSPQQRGVSHLISAPPRHAAQSNMTKKKKEKMKAEVEFVVVFMFLSASPPNLAKFLGRA